MSPKLLGRVHVLWLYAAYYFVLQISYALVESTLYTELGLRYLPPNLFYQTLGLVMVLIPPMLVDFTFDRPSHLIFTILYLTVFAPAMFIPYHVLDMPPSKVLVLCSMMLAMFVILALFCKMPIVELKPPKLTERQVLFLSMVASALLTFLCAANSGFHLQLSLDNIYDRRMDAREAVLGGSLAAYGIANLSSAIGPLLVAIGYVRKNIHAVLVGGIGMLSVFSFSGTKHDLIAPIFMLGIFILASQKRHRRRTIVLFGAIGLIVLSITQFLVLERNEISLYLCRRLLIFPATITSYYWDFFSNHEFIYYSDSFLRWALRSPYDLPMARLIGEEFFGSHEANANANVWASAFGHAGYLGMLATTIGLGYLLRFMDSLASHAGYRVVTVMGGLFAICWSNGAFETTLLSNGVFVSLVILYFLPSENARHRAACRSMAKPRRSYPTAETSSRGQRNLAKE